MPPMVPFTLPGAHFSVRVQCSVQEFWVPVRDSSFGVRFHGEAEHEPRSKNEEA
jgi:hypothetical protein